VSFTGSCIKLRSAEGVRDLFEMWLAQSLIPQLQLGEVIVIDNASFDHAQTIKEMIAEAECEIWYLSTDSPDLNEIEHCWFPLKNWMRQRWDKFDSVRDCVDAAFKESPNVYA
jgi:transposase